jgi:hypothetical protein
MYFLPFLPVDNNKYKNELLTDCFITYIPSVKSNRQREIVRGFCFNAFLPFQSMGNK